MTNPNPNPLYTKANFDMDAIIDTAKELREFEKEFRALFPEREHLIHKMILAILCKHHVLIYGKYGTAKSMLIKQFVEGIGADKDKLFTIELTRYTTESDVFGPIDVPKLREEGVQVRNPVGTMRAAHFVDVGEIFDAQGLLRSMLGTLNERFYSRGADSGAVPLHTAFASTNVDPKELIRRYPDSDAIIDRFLFHSKVNWLSDDASFRKMFSNILGGKTSVAPVDHDSLLEAARLVSSPTDQIKPELIDTYIEIVKTIREIDEWKRFSDRAFAQWLVVLEANAVLNGRYDVGLEDFYALKYVVCNGADHEQVELFDDKIAPIIAQAIENKQAMSIDDAVLLAIDAIENDWPATPDANSTASDLQATYRKLKSHLEKAETMHPQLPETEQKIAALKTRISDEIMQTLVHFEGAA